MLRAGDDSATRNAEPLLQKRLLLRAVARRGLPGIVEASLVPAVIFMLTNSFFGARSAMVAVLTWGCASAILRRHRGHRMPALVVIGVAALTLRTLIGVVSGSTFAYFVQPVATTMAIAAVLVGSVLVGRPLIARIAHDFCPIAPDVAARPSVTTLFAGLTFLWAGAQVLTAGATLTLLLSLDTSLFVVLKPIVTIGISAAAVAVTVTWALRIAHREELVLATA
jgi:hypothetical protein